MTVARKEQLLEHTGKENAVLAQTDGARQRYLCRDRQACAKTSDRSGAAVASPLFALELSAEVSRMRSCAPGARRPTPAVSVIANC